MTDANDRPEVDETAAGTDRFAAQLKQDVRSWSARDNVAPDRHAEAALELGTKQVKAATATPRKRAKAAAATPPVAAPTGTKSRPFSMSYEGVSNEQYLAGRIARGAR
jgi:Tfp pilus assembly protein PilX